MSLSEIINPLLSSAQQTMVRALYETFHTLPPTGMISPSWKKAVQQFESLPPELSESFLTLEMIESADPYFQHFDYTPYEKERQAHEFLSTLMNNTPDHAVYGILSEIYERIQKDGMYVIPFLIQEHWTDAYNALEDSRKPNLARSLMKHMKSTAMVQRVR